MNIEICAATNSDAGDEVAKCDAEIYYNPLKRSKSPLRKNMLDEKSVESFE